MMATPHGPGEEEVVDVVEECLHETREEDDDRHGEGAVVGWGRGEGPLKGKGTRGGRDQAPLTTSNVHKAYEFGGGKLPPPLFINRTPPRFLGHEFRTQREMRAYFKST